MLAEFSEVNDASHAVSAIIAGGIMPAGLEMMDREIIRAVEASVFAAGLPLDVGAALLIELDGIEAGLDEEAERVKAICLKHGARNCRLARDEHERKRLWAARKGAFGAIGRISPDSMIQDAVVPRSRLPEVLDAAYQIASKYQLRIANVFHAGDGNLHPLICFDSRFPDEVHRVKEAGRELMETCVRAGGSITGEHGVGLDKRELLPLIFSEADMAAMLEVRAAFDPTGLCNPGKIIPLLRGCGEARAIQTGTAGVSPTSTLKDTEKLKHDFFELTRNPIDVGSVARRVVLPECGATVTLDGYAREWTRGRRTLHLVYEAYAPMAERELIRLGGEAHQRFEIAHIGIVHRIGRLELGETSVVIAVGAPHRRAAFEACEWAIKELKRTVPIWKKEFFEDGEVWVEGEGEKGKG
jgi:molybdopterin synthase catalytic subunit